jgi:hypothetical protein
MAAEVVVFADLGGGGTGTRNHGSEYGGGNGAQASAAGTGAAEDSGEGVEASGVHCTLQGDAAASAAITLKERSRHAYSKK